MSFNTKTSSSSSSSPQQDLKARVITCLNKLSDRDTLTIAATELNNIAKTLTEPSFNSFITCIHNTDSDTKSPVRKHCVNLLSLLSLTHGNSLSTHFPKMLSFLLRRLHDNDSSVRSACVSAAADMAANVTKPPFTTLSKPLVEMVAVEQDVNVKAAAAMCLAAAVEAAPEVDAVEMRKVVGRVVKVVRSDGGKGKGAAAACLGLLGSLVGVEGVVGKGCLDVIVGCFVQFLGCEDWGARKAAAEGLGKVALLGEEMAGEYKKECAKALENRRFDKVKVVRETMNRALELWKEVPGDSDEVSVGSLSRSSSMGSDNRSSGCFPSVSKSSNGAGSRTPQLNKKTPPRNSPPSGKSSLTPIPKENHIKSRAKVSGASASSRLKQKKLSDWKVEIVVPQPPLKESCEDDQKPNHIRIVGTHEDEGSGNSKPEVKRALFRRDYDDKPPPKFGGFKYGSRVAPLPSENDSPKSVVTADDANDEDCESHEDLSMIRNQLIQIENQQSNLLEMLQRFMGNSQCGINSLETRVHGLEMALEEIYHDMAASSGRNPGSFSEDNTCCKLPGTEFLSPKFWRRTEGRLSTSRFSSWGTQAEGAGQDTLNDGVGSYEPRNQRFHLQSGGLVTKAMGNVPQNSREKLEYHPSADLGKLHGAERTGFRNDRGFDGIPLSIKH